MKAHPRIKTITLCVAAALAQLSTAAQADSGVGVDTTLGNAMNPATVSSIREKDPDGLGQAEFSRNPTGFLNSEPSLIREPNETASGWHYLGSVEAGAIGVYDDKKNAKFKEYKDLDSGLYLNNFGVAAEHADSAMFVEALGGGVGMDDQYYGLSVGRYNDWKLKGFYSETPHVFTTTYRNLWNGTGSKNMTLKTLAPGGTTNAATTDANIEAAALATPYSELGIVRKKGGVRFDMNLGEEWSIFTSYTNEKKEGARPFGLVMGGGGGTGGVEIPESIDNDTHDFFVGARWKDALSALNLQAQVSLFRNNIDTMTVENPMFLAAANGIASHTLAQYDMHPDNEYYNLKGEYARSFPDLMKARITAVVSAAALRQNDKFIPSTTHAGATAAGVAGGSWDTLASLSKDSANAKIDTRLLDLGLSLTPVDALDVRTKFRHYETQNDTEYFACNPLTGQWGRLTNDGSGAQVVTNVTGCGLYNSPSATVPNAGNINIRNVPFEYKQDILSLSADYRLNRSNSINASYEREIYKREHRERDKTWEDKVKVGYVNRGIEDGTLRLSLEGDRRRGSTYNPDPYHEFYSTHLGALPAAGATVNTWVHVLNQLRKFDLADRDQYILNARFNYAFAPNLDGGLSLQLKDAKYPDSDYGRNDHQTQNSLNLDITLRASEDTSLYGFYSFQDGKIKQANIHPSAVNCVLGTNVNSIEECGDAGNVRFPLSRGWNLTQKDRNDALGLGLTHKFARATLDMNYTYVKGRSKIDYNYDPSAGGLNLTPTVAALAGSGFPALTFTQNILETNLLVPVTKSTSVRLIYRYEDGKFADWHYDAVDVNPSPAANQQTYLDAGPEDYQVHVIGALVKYDF